MHHIKKQRHGRFLYTLAKASMQSSWFHSLRQANSLPALALYLVYGHDSKINPYIYLFTSKLTVFPKLSNFHYYHLA